MREVLYNAAASLGGAALDFQRTAALGSAVGKVFCKVYPSRYRLAAEAIARRLGKEQGEAEKLAKRSIQENFTSFLEILAGRRVDWRFLRDRLEIADPESFALAQKPDGPMIFATAHLGSWELLAGAMGLLVDAPSRQVVVRRPKDMALHRVMSHMRSGAGVEILEHRMAVFKLLRALKRGGVAAFLVDHNTGRDEAVFLPFLGRTAAVNAGPALLAVRAGAKVMPAFLVRIEPGRYRLHTEAPLDPVGLEGDREDRIRETAAFYTAKVEKYVRMYPEQWFWMHRRWKTRPPGE
jgi:KDO2-lipid IV(A) lauroyltransferase